jgi:hypothetical protein
VLPRVGAVGLSAVSFYSVIPAKAGSHNKKDAALIPNTEKQYDDRKKLYRK